jgi:hypothetical protein
MSMINYSSTDFLSNSPPSVVHSEKTQEISHADSWH